MTNNLIDWTEYDTYQRRVLALEKALEYSRNQVSGIWDIGDLINVASDIEDYLTNGKKG